MSPQLASSAYAQSTEAAYLMDRTRDGAECGGDNEERQGVPKPPRQPPGTAEREGENGRKDRHDDRHNYWYRDRERRRP